MTTEAPTKNLGGRPREHTIRNEDRRRDWEQAKADFLEAFKERGTIKGACQIARCAPKTVTLWEREDEEFRLAWKAVRDDLADEMEGSLLVLARRLNDSNLEKGDRRNCLSATIFLLKGMRPDKWRENYRYQQHRMQKAEESALRNLSDDELKRLLASAPAGDPGGTGEEEPGVVRDLRPRIQPGGAPQGVD